MKIQKVLTSTFAAVLMISMLAGCSAAAGGESSQTADNSAANSQPQESNAEETSGNYADTITLVWYPNESAEAPTMPLPSNPWPAAPPKSALWERRDILRRKTPTMP